MPPSIEAPSTRRHLMIRDDDWEFLNMAYGPGSRSKMGISNALRELIHTSVMRMRARVEARLDQENLIGPKTQAPADNRLDAPTPADNPQRPVGPASSPVDHPRGDARSRADSPDGSGATHGLAGANRGAQLGGGKPQQDRSGA